jgi:(p)ppGpp synthase/HD superfamily hydrolase
LTDLGARYADAVGWAVELHAGQVRKASSTPYVAHLVHVSALVLEFGGDEDEAIAALLHDALEDTHATRADIEERYGPTIAAIVACCSDAETRPKPPWRQRKERFLERLQASPEPGVLRVVGADKLHNARSLVRDHHRLGDALWEHFNAGPQEQLWYHREVAALVAASPGGDLSRELDAAVDALAAIVP